MELDSLHSLIQPYSWACSGEPTHHLYLIPGAQVARWRKQGLLRVWSCNRKYDKKRVDEIRLWQDERNHVNGTIHFAELEGEGVVCYEGNHRFQAVTAEISWVLVDIMWNTTVDDVYEEFNAINSAQLVPKIYKKQLEDPEKIVRDKIATYVADICEAYPKLASTKERANRPGFVGSELTDRISKRYKFFQHNGGYTIEELLQAIDYLNMAVADGSYDLRPDLKSAGIKRAELNGFYLYTAKEPLKPEDLRWALSECEK